MDRPISEIVGIVGVALLIIPMVCGISFLLWKAFTIIVSEMPLVAQLSIFSMFLGIILCFVAAFLEPFE